MEKLSEVSERSNGGSGPGSLILTDVVPPVSQDRLGGKKTLEDNRDLI